MPSIPIFTLSVTAAEALTARTFVTAQGATAPAAGPALGVTRSDGAVGEIVPADALGTAVVLSGDAVAAGDALEVGDGGTAVPQSTGVTVARALSAAGAADTPIDVFLIPN